MRIVFSFRLWTSSRGAAVVAFLLLSLTALSGPAVAQNVVIPNYWDPGERLQKPDLSALPRLRFLTTTDFPPFNFLDAKQRLSGFHVDLARAVCAQLGLLAKCQIQALPWDELEEALARGQGEAIIAGLQANEQNREKFEFSRAFLHIPGRFAARRQDGHDEPMFRTLARNVTGLVAGSSHKQWFGQAFPRARTRIFATRLAALEALAAGSIDLVFSDAVGISFWLASQSSKDCCAFAGGAYFSDPAIDQKLTIAFAKGRGDLASAADYALKQINAEGMFAELYLRYFPLGLY